MEYLDFVPSEVHGLRIKELQDAKARGRKIAGTFCVFVPEELALAVDAVQVGLCAGADAGRGCCPECWCCAKHLRADQVLHRLQAGAAVPLHRVLRSHRRRDHLRDGGKAYEAFAEHAPMHIMEVPQTTSRAPRALWKAEVPRPHGEA